MNIERNLDRIKQTGEVFTPTKLVKQILSKLPSVVWTNHDKTFCDPACGDGQFLVEVLKRKLASGAKLSKAVRMIYGVDLMVDNIELCKIRMRQVLMDVQEAQGNGRKLSGCVNNILNNNIVCHDALAWDFENWCTFTTYKQKKDEQCNELLNMNNV